MSWSDFRSTRYILLGAIILLFFVSLAAALYDQRRRTEVFEKAFRNTSWSVAQIEREFLLLDARLAKYMGGDESIGHDDVVVQFEIFWSRIPIILEGPEGSEIRKIPGTEELLHSITGTLEQIEPLVYRLGRDDHDVYETIDARLDSFSGPLHRLAQDTMVYTESQAQKLTSDTSVFRVSIFLFGILATGTVLVVLLLRDRARVSTLLDATRAAEQRAKAAREQLSEAIEISPDGIVLFDANGRLVFANTRYREIYGLSSHDAAPGTHFGSILRTVIDKGVPFVSGNDHDKWVAQRTAHFGRLTGPVEQKLADGRWIRINERKTRDGGVIGLRADITDIKDREQHLSRLAQQNQQFATAIAGASIGVLIARTDAEQWRITHANQHFCEIAGVSQDEIHEQPWQRHCLLSSGEVEASRNELASGRRYMLDTRITRADGTEMHVEARFSPVLDRDGRITAAVGLYDDITERIERLEALRRSEARLKSLATHVPGVLYQRRHTTNRDSEYIYVSERLEELFPVDARVVQTDASVLAEVVHPEDRADWQRAMSLEQADDKPRVLEHRFRGRDDETLWIRTLEQAERQPDGSTVWSGLMLNVSDQKLIESRLEYLAYHDPLTGLANRTLFEDRLGQAMAFAARRNRAMALLYIDVDNFKEVNDTLGHKTGDELLVAISESLCRTVRETDTVARISGDEFAIIQTDLDAVEDAMVLAERLLSAVSRPMQLADHILSTGCSIGLAVYQGEDLRVEELPMRADIALYCAKADGRGTYRFYDQAMDTEIRTRIDTRDRLRTAIERDELVLHYQPQVRLDDFTVVGIEALIRWRGNDGSLRSPADFIPVAEESSLIVDIGEWVLRTACRQLKTWQAEGLPEVFVSVNMSPEQFRRSDVFNSVRGILAETGLDARCLEIEITENVFLENSARVSAALVNLRALGVRISIDDFGTGYSSLGYLKSFPVDKLKIDRHFLKGRRKSEIDAAIVQSIIYIATQLDLDVIAEGIESAEHARWLREFGCMVGQGFFLCRPCDAPGLEEFWHERLNGPGIDQQIQSGR